MTDPNDPTNEQINEKLDRLNATIKAREDQILDLGIYEETIIQCTSSKIDPGFYLGIKKLKGYWSLCILYNKSGWIHLTEASVAYRIRSFNYFNELEEAIMKNRYILVEKLDKLLGDKL